MPAGKPAAEPACAHPPVRLLAADDDDFVWMLDDARTPGGLAAARRGLQLPDGGVEAPVILDIVRGMTRDVLAKHDRGSWLIVSDAIVVGLCSYKHPPYPNGEVEIGYGITEAFRCRGYATQAVASVVMEAARDPAVSRLTAATAIANHASRRVLERNEFLQKGTRNDPEDGTLLLWSRVLKAGSASF